MTDEIDLAACWFCGEPAEPETGVWAQGVYHPMCLECM